MKGRGEETGRGGVCLACAWRVLGVCLNRTVYFPLMHDSDGDATAFPLVAGALRSGDGSGSGDRSETNEAVKNNDM